MAFGKFEADIGLADALLRAGELFVDRGLAAEKRPRDFPGAKAAEHFEREHDLRVRRKGRVAADKHQSQRVVADLLSPSTAMPPAAGSVCSRCVMMSGSFEADIRRWRSVSRARFIATRVIHADGLAGTPPIDHVRNARSSASCATSSTSVRLSAEQADQRAVQAPVSWRKKCSTTSDACADGDVPSALAARVGDAASTG